MKPTKFKYQNRVLERPAGMSSDQCGALPIWTDGEQCVSCWKMTFWERLKVLLHGRVWLSVMSGGTQAPVSLCVDTEYFKEE